MKRLIAALSLAAGFAAQATPKQDVTGDWRGALAKGALRSVTYVHFAERDGRWEGSFWGGDPASIALRDVRVDVRHVHFEVPGIASFDGVIDGEQISGTFRDQGGDGTFAMRKEASWDDPMGAP